MVFSFSANSQPNNTPIAQCDDAKPKLSAIKYSQCLDTVKAKVDKELKTWVNNQLFILEDIAKTTGRKSAYQMFKRSQNNFITYRENNCKWQFLVELPSSDAATAYKKCYIMTSKDKIAELNRVSK
jgi:uncharacterized protein YecT (DUF1311 family)